MHAIADDGFRVPRACRSVYDPVHLNAAMKATMSNVRVIAIALTLLPAFAGAQSRFLHSPEEARTVTEGIIASVAAGNMAGALKELQPLQVIQATEFDVFKAQVNSQQENILRMFGAPGGYEFVREDKLGSRLERFQYLVFHEKAAMRWNFVLYKAEKGWVISHFVFDGNAVAFFPASN